MTALWTTLRAVVMAGAGVCVVWLAGLIWFAMPPAAETPEPSTDAIVVLTGGSLRLQRGIELLLDGKGRKLFVSGVNHQVDLEDLLRGSGGAPDWVPNWAACCVVLGHEADNTLGNAHETARWMRSQGYHSLRLVTAWYHMPRSLLEFNRAMPEIEIISHPVFPEGVKPEHWWAWRGTAGLLVGEYVKYQAALFRPLVERLHPRSDGASEPSQAAMRR